MEIHINLAGSKTATCYKKIINMQSVKLEKEMATHSSIFP